MIAQFGPYNWVQFEWRPLSSLGRWCATLGIMFIVSNPVYTLQNISQDAANLNLFSPVLVDRA